MLQVQVLSWAFYLVKDVTLQTSWVDIYGKFHTYSEPVRHRMQRIKGLVCNDRFRSIWYISRRVAVYERYDRMMRTYLLKVYYDRSFAEIVRSLPLSDAEFITLARRLLCDIFSPEYKMEAFLDIGDIKRDNVFCSFMPVGA